MLGSVYHYSAIIVPYGTIIIKIIVPFGTNIIYTIVPYGTKKTNDYVIILEVDNEDE